MGRLLAQPRADRQGVTALLERWRNQRWSIHAQFLLYSLAVLVPALVFSGLMILRSATLERRSVEREVQDVAQSLAAAIDRELSARITTLKALASSPSLAEGDLKAFYSQAMAAQQVGGDDFILTDRSGKQLVNTRVPPGEPLADGAVPANLAAESRKVFTTGETTVSNLHSGTEGNGASFTVSVPVHRRKRVTFALSASVAPKRILDILDRETLRNGWGATVSDRAGVIIARSGDAAPDVGRQAAADLAAGQPQQTGLWATTSAAGEPVLQAVASPRQSGWLVSTTVPVAVANRPITRSWSLAATLALSFGILSALLAFVFGGKISGPVRNLAASAAALGRGDEVRPISTSILEVHAAGMALAEARETRLRMEQSLRDSEDRLRLALASADTGIWDWDLTTGAQTWDKRMRELWGLGPDEPVTYEAFVSALHPDDREPTLAAVARAQDPGSSVEYDVEHRVKCPHGDERWIAVRGRAHFVDNRPVRMTGTARDITERKRWEDRTHLLMREVTHRSKNLLAVIQAMARQSKVGCTTVADFERRFSGRLQALAASQDLLVQRDWNGVSIGELVRSQLAHYLDQRANQIKIDGQRLIVTPEAAQNIGLAVHELSTNAAKYGALSVPQGEVTVHWSCTGERLVDSRFQMTWVERGGPPVTPPAQMGFGQVVMEQLAARALQGEARLKFSPEGVRWSLDIPARHVLWDHSKSKD